MSRIIRPYYKDIKGVIGDLNRLKKDLKRMEKNLTNDLKDETEVVMNNYVESIKNLDGNYDVGVSSTKNKVSFQGSQVVYVEYGTGLTGQSNQKSPKQPQDYKQSDRKQWYYKNKKTGLFKKSVGIPAYMPVFKTYVDMNQRKFTIAKRLLREVLDKNDFNN